MHRCTSPLLLPNFIATARDCHVGAITTAVEPVGEQENKQDLATSRAF